MCFPKKKLEVKEGIEFKNEFLLQSKGKGKSSLLKEKISILINQLIFHLFPLGVLKVNGLKKGLTRPAET